MVVRLIPAAREACSTFSGWPAVTGHIVGMRPPGLISWLAALALFGGILGYLVDRSGRRRLWGVLAVAGLAGSVFDIVQRSAHPSRPDLVIRLVSPPARTGQPLVVRVCGTSRSGRQVPAVAEGRYLLVKVDGVQVAESHLSTVAIPVRPGRHQLTVEVTSPYHQEFAPPLTIQRDVWVSATGVSSVPGCSGD